MRKIFDTLTYPPRNGERFLDGNAVVEYNELNRGDKMHPCDRCYYSNEPHCNDRGCVRVEYADMLPICGYYVKVDAESRNEKH